MIAIDLFLSEWRWARLLSRSVLEVLPESSLITQPLACAGPWWKQFRHLARVQENYIQALQTCRINFSVDTSAYSGGSDRAALLSYLDESDQKLFQAIKARSLPTQIDWFGDSISLELHLARLLSHETLHHGQFIIYARQTGLTLPKCWRAWGEGGRD